MGLRHPRLERRIQRRLEGLLAVVGEHQCGLLDITGDHELIYGEVDDARAAVRWLGEQPGSDGARPPPSQP